MLDRSKIIRELSTRSTTIFNALHDERDRAFGLWQLISDDPAFCATAWAFPGNFIVPSWIGPLNQRIRVNQVTSYNVIAFDGSQIYPDRHQGIDCFLINIGQAHFHYEAEKSAVFFDSTPTVFFSGDAGPSDFTPDSVNAYRTEQELKTALSYVKASLENAGPSLFLFDGSLIFWHLQSPQEDSQKDFLPRYLALLDDFYTEQFLFAGYISLSKSKELVNVLKIAAEIHKKSSEFIHIVDGDIAEFYLKPGERSLVFANHSPIVSHYPVHSRPHFFYINTGDEIARVEIPAWIATNPEKLELVASMIYDQIAKGYGYPISLAEAHEQAVVSHADRDFFYYLLKSSTQKTVKPYIQSSKSLKKRRASI
jgi:hypothetical protein